MPNYIVGYDLNSPGQNYKELHEAIKAYGYYYHVLSATWLIKTTQTAAQVRDNLKQHIDSNDKLLVMRLSGEGAWTGGLDNEWLKKFLNSP